MVPNPSFKSAKHLCAIKTIYTGKADAMVEGHQDHFYVTLPSTSSSKCFGRHHPLDYYTALSAPVNDVEATLGKLELLVSLSRTWLNIPESVGMVSIPRFSLSISTTVAMLKGSICVDTVMQSSCFESYRK